jgi:RNA polymerase sigma-70 factor (ECF subfamily)
MRVADGSAGPDPATPPKVPPVMTDAAVIRRSRLEPELFAVLFDRHAPFIHRYVNRRVGRQAADDLVAETFLAAFGKREQYDPGYPDARPWLYGFATNVIGQHRREEVRQYRIRQAVIPDLDLPDPAERAAADLTARAARDTLVAALAALPPGDRDVLILIAWEELTYPEVARALDIPVGTVRSRLNRARRTIRAALAAGDPAGAFREVLGDD